MQPPFSQKIMIKSKAIYSLKRRLLQMEIIKNKESNNDNREYENKQKA